MAGTTHIKPTYQGLFGNMDYHEHDPSRTVLSPAAYFVELMDLIEKYIEVDTSVSGAVELQKRRKDLWDKVVLDQANTDTEIQKLDKVISVLENFLSSGEYQDLSTSTYPFNLPYDKEYQALRIYLSQSGTSLSEIWQEFGSIAATTNDLNTSICFDTLGITQAQWGFLSTSIGSDLNKAYGLETGDNTAAVLSNASKFIDQCGINPLKLNELVYQDLSSVEMSESNNPQTSFYINKGLPTPITVRNGTINNLTSVALDRIRRFMGLAEMLGWSYQDLDWALKCISEENSDHASISGSLGYLTWISQMVQKGLSISEASAMVGHLRGYGKKNGPTPFDQVFNNPNIPNNPEDARWYSSEPTWNISQAVNGNVQNQSVTQNALAIALGLSHADLRRLGKLLGASVKLDENGLAQLYRLSLLPRLTGMTAEEIAVAAAIIAPIDGKNIEALLQSGTLEDRLTAVHRLEDFAKRTKRVPFSIQQLAFIATGSSDDPQVSHLVPKGNQLTNWKAQLQQAISSPFITKNVFNEALTPTLTDGLSAMLDEPQFVEEVGDQVLGELRAKFQEMLDVLLAGMYLALGTQGILKNGEVQSASVSENQFDAITIASIGDLIQQVEQRCGKQPDWKSQKWKENISVLLNKYFNKRQKDEHVIQTHLAGILQMPYIGKSIRSWAEAYLKAIQPNVTNFSWVGAIQYLVTSEDDQPLTGLLAYLQRVNLLIQNFGLSESESQYFLSVMQGSINLSVAFVEHIGIYRHLTQKFSDQQDILLDLIKSSTTLKDEASLSAFVKLTGWNKDSIGLLTDTSGTPKLATVTITNVRLLDKFFQLQSALGLDTPTTWSLLKLPGSFNSASFNAAPLSQAIFGGLQARLGTDSQAVLTLQNTLKKQYRDRLVSLTMHQLGVRDARDLFNYFLIDTQVSGVPVTSEVREAISAAQLYVQRCVNHMEPGVTFSMTNSPSISTIWKWMSTFSSWEANKEVFLFPENYLQPELRTNCSPEFTNLITHIRSADRTDARSYENAYKRFFTEVFKVSNIQVLSIARLSQRPGDEDPFDFFLVGQRKGDPKEYYYQIVKGTLIQGTKTGDLTIGEIQWGFWQKIHGPNPVIFENDYPCFSPKYVFGKWHLFWLEQELDTSGSNSNGDSNIGQNTTSKRHYKVSCCYATLEADGTWSSVQKGAHSISGSLKEKSLHIRQYISFVNDNDSNDPPTMGVNYEYVDLTSASGAAAQGSFTLQSLVSSDANSTVVWTITEPNNHDYVSSFALDKSLPDKTSAATYLPMQSAFLATMDQNIHQQDGIQVMFSSASCNHWPNVQQDLMGNQIFSNYFWELLFHAPFLIARELQTHENFDWAKTWYEYIFNPQAVGSSDVGNDRFWKFPGLRQSVNSSLGAELGLYASEKQLSELASRAQNSVSATDPFDPQAIAAIRPLAYQKSIFAHYFRNLLDWGDSLMRQNTRESINEAEMTYIMAADLLGTRPADLGAAESRPALPFKDMVTVWKVWTNSDANLELHHNPFPVFARLENDILVNLGGLWLSIDGGNSWNEQSPSQQLGATNYAPTKWIEVFAFQDNFYAVSDSNYLWQYADDSWVLMVDPGDVSKPLEVDFTTVGELYNGQPGLIVVSHKNKNVWQYVGDQTWIRAASDFPSEIDSMICAEGYLYAAGGSSIWSVALIPGTSPSFEPNGSIEQGFGQMYFKRQGNYLLLLGEYGKIYYTQISTAGPGNWISPHPHVSASFFITDDIWLTTGFNQNSNVTELLWSSDQGNTWNVANVQGNPDFHGQNNFDLFQSNQTLYLRHNNRGFSLYKSLDGGVNWRKATIEYNSEALDLNNLIWIGGQDGARVVATTDSIWTSRPLKYFSVPQNLQMLSYWDEVNQRLYDIDHGLNLEGELDILPLFNSVYGAQNTNTLALSESALEQLVGSDFTTIPHYRFNYMIEKAKEACSDLRSLGSALLSALESKDAAKLAKLYLSNEQNIQGQQELVQQNLLTQANQDLQLLNFNKQGIQKRASHYRNLINNGLSIGEIYELSALSAKLITSIPIPVFAAVKAGMADIPTIAGTADGGSHPTKQPEGLMDIFKEIADILDTSGKISGLSAGYVRRADDWTYEHDCAQDDLTKINQQIAMANSKIKLAQQELAMVQSQIAQKSDVAQFMLQKFTNEQLYQWYVTQLKVLYYQSYELAMEYAVLAENCRKFEQNLTIEATSFITGNYWNNLQDGLLAGEKLHQDLKLMEKHYIENNSRPLFIEKPISLCSFDPLQFATLISTGTCTFSVTERELDFDFPGHYNRRISKVSVFVELKDGASGHINATLRQLTNKVVGADDANGENAAQYLLNPKSADNQNGTSLNPANPAYLSDVRSGQSVIMSQGPSDPEMLIVNSNDSRYLPFEGTGAISTWQLDMSRDGNAMNLNQIKDIKVHLYYSAHEGITTFRQTVIGARGSFHGSMSMALASQQPDAWSRFIDQSQPKALKWSTDPSSWRANGNSYTINKIRVLAIGEEGTFLPKITLSIPQITEATAVNLTPSINTIVEGTVPSGGISLDLTNTEWQLSVTTGSGSGKKEASVPAGLKELLLFIDYSISFPAS